MTPATYIAAKGSEKYWLLDTIKGEESQKRRRTSNDVNERDRNRSLNNTNAVTKSATFVVMKLGALSKSDQKRRLSRSLSALPIYY